MGRIRLVTDSTCDLSEELIKRCDIIVLPLYVNFGEESYRDLVDITTEELYQKVSEKGYLPKTAAVTREAFYDVFKEIVDNGDEAIYMGLSRQMSSTFEHAYLAARDIDLNKIKVIDSKNLSTGIGLLLLKARRMIEEGKSLNAINDYLLLAVDRLKIQFVIPTMEYLYKGGRCSSLTKLIGTVLKITPIIEVRDGSMKVGRKPRGNIKHGLDALLSMLDSDKGKVEEDVIFVTHSLASESANYLMEEIRKRYPNINLYETNAGSVISSHCGKGTIGILYMVK